MGKKRVKTGKEQRAGLRGGEGVEHTGTENEDVGTDDRAMNTHGEELKDSTKDHEPRDG